jgi:GST-like protein
MRQRERATRMIELYTYGTANGQRASVMLELCGLPYQARKVDLAKGEQKAPAFLAINPSGAIPAIVDPDGPDGRPLALSQSGAIILYLAEKTGRFLPEGGTAGVQALQWFVAVMTEAAQASSYIFYTGRAEPAPPEHITAHMERRFLAMVGDLDRRLAEAPYLAGDELSIADIALYPTTATRKGLIERAEGLAHVRRWAAAMAAMPEVQRGMAVPG